MGDNDFPTIMANGGGEDFLRKYTKGFSQYSQAGTDLIPVTLQSKHAQINDGPIVGSKKVILG